MEKDSTAETLLHIKRVNELLINFSKELMYRATVHDTSKINEPEKFLEELQEKMHEYRGHLGNEIRHQVRHIPELDFRLDDTLDNVFRLEELFKKIKK